MHLLMATHLKFLSSGTGRLAAPNFEPPKVEDEIVGHHMDVLKGDIFKESVIQSNQKDVHGYHH